MEDSTLRFSQWSPQNGVHPLDILRQAHAEELRLCDALEEIADSLPSNINAGKCFLLAHSISPLIRDIHKFEQGTLFPLMKSRPYPPGELAATVERLKVEHFTDECYADELTEKLLQLGCGRHDVNMEATGYMLRGFFETMRRQISFEQHYFFGSLEGSGGSFAS